MENTFENAVEYLSKLKEINPNALYDEKVLASCLMSYSAKTNIIDENVLNSFASKFRKFQTQWNLFDKKEITKKPPCISEFISNILTEFDIYRLR